MLTKSKLFHDHLTYDIIKRSIICSSILRGLRPISLYQISNTCTVLHVVQALHSCPYNTTNR